MNLPDGRPLTLGEGIFAEPDSADGRIVLWLSGEDAGGYRCWERVGSVPHAEVSGEGDVRAVPATSFPARQRLGGGFRDLFRWPGESRGAKAWTLPNGAVAEQCGARRTDLVLAWSDEIPGLPGRIRARWPACEEVRTIAPDLYLVRGIDPDRPQHAPTEEPEAESAAPDVRAERALAEARRTGDPRRCSIALADLGLARLQGRDARRGVELMEEALAEARRSGDPAQELNATIDLGMAAVVSGDPARARDVLGPALDRARAAGDRFAEKAALERLGQAHMAQGDRVAALVHYERALALAAGLGDGASEADLLWLAALLHAELGRRDRAVALAQAAVDRMRRLGKPQAAWYAHHLDLFRSGAAGTPPRGPDPAREALAPSMPATAVALRSPAAAPGPSGTDRGPGALRMALSSIGSMAKFLGSGFRTAPAATYRDRLEACSSCEHHTGLRCRLCGCFTAAKAHLLHERCPAARWRD